MCVGHSISLNDEDRLDSEKKFNTICSICGYDCEVEQDPKDPDFYLVSELE